MKRDYLLCTTAKKNNYLYSFAKNQILLIHPVLKQIIVEYQNGADLIEWISSFDNELLVINGIQTTQKELEYQYSKFCFYQESGFFQAASLPDFTKKISGEDVKQQLANLRQVTFEVTDRCNLKCEYCGYGKFYSDYDDRSNINLDISKAKRLLDYLTELWNSTYNNSQNKNVYISFYGGEPLLNMNFIKGIVDYAKCKIAPHLKIQFSMTTNGVLLEKNIDFLVENKFWLLISLDGNKKNNSYRIFGNGEESFECIKSQIEFIQKEYPGYFEKYVSFNTVLHNRNSMDEIFEFFSKNFQKNPTISELNNVGITSSLKQEFNTMFRNLNESLFNSENYDQISRDMFINLPDNQSLGIFCNQFTKYYYKEYLDFYLSRKNIRQTPTGTCFPFSKRLFVTVNGKILPCERIGQQFGFGHVHKDSIDLDFDLIAERYNNYFDKFRSKCASCYRSDACTQCIFNLESIEESQPYCLGFLGKKNFIEYMSLYISALEANPENYMKLMNEVTIE